MFANLSVLQMCHQCVASGFALSVLTLRTIKGLEHWSVSLHAMPNTRSHEHMTDAIIEDTHPMHSQRLKNSLMLYAVEGFFYIKAGKTHFPFPSQRLATIIFLKPLSHHQHQNVDQNQISLHVASHPGGWAHPRKGA